MSDLSSYMQRSEDIALENAGELTMAQIDRIRAKARILAARDWLFPGGKPPQPWSIAEYQIWQRLTAEADKIIITQGETDDPA